LGMGLTTPHHRKQTSYENEHKTSDLDRFYV
jgi:hypothetical protein